MIQTLLAEFQAGRFFARRSVVVLRVTIILAPFFLWAAADTVRSNKNRVEDWLPSTFSETQELRWFRENFPSDQFVVISWDGCRLGGAPEEVSAEPDDPRIAHLTSLLCPSVSQGVRSIEREKTASSGYERYFRSVTTARGILDELTSPPTELDYHEAVRRLVGSLVGPDLRQTCVIAALTDEGQADLHASIGRGDRGWLRTRREPGALYRALAEVGVDPATIRLVGPPVDNVSIDEEGERTLIRLAGMSGLLGLGLSWWCLQSVRLTAMVFCCGVLCAAIGLATVSVMGYEADAILMSMPALVYVLAISGAVHLINHYRDALVRFGPRQAPWLALMHGWRPALLCSVSTAIGLASLYASELAPIRKFGLFSALGVLTTLPVLFVVLPAALQLFPERKRAPVEKSDQSHESVRHTWIDGLWEHLGSWIIKRHGFVTLACTLGIVLAGYGVSFTRTSIDLLKLFDPSAKILDDYRWMESHLGRLVPMEVVVRIPIGHASERQDAGPSEDHPLTFLERMEFIRHVQQTVEQRFGRTGADVLGRCMTAVDFAPELPAPSSATVQFATRSATNLRLERSKQAFEETGYLRTNARDGLELWRISLGLAAFQNVDYGEFTDELKATIQPLLRLLHLRSEVIDAVQQSSHHDAAQNRRNVVIWYPPPATSVNDAEHDKSKLGAERQRSSILAEMLAPQRMSVRQISLDPHNVTPAQRDWLQKADCVVAMGAFSLEQIESLRESFGQVVDGRDVPQKVFLATSAAPNPSVPNVASIDAVYTGVVPIVYKAQRALLTSLIESTIWSFATITPLMMFVARGFAPGCVVMLPNALPVLVVFGGMGWLGISVDIGSMMSASIALGVAVDDTIHFLTWFREDLNVVGDRHAAILKTYRRCATPTLQAALISGLGLSVFALSTFTPTQRFGWLMLTILIAGAVAELILFPALLAGPLGRVFSASHYGMSSEESRGPHVAAQQRHAPAPHVAFHELSTLEQPNASRAPLDRMGG